MFSTVGWFLSEFGWTLLRLRRSWWSQRLGRFLFEFVLASGFSTTLTTSPSVLKIHPWCRANHVPQHFKRPNFTPCTLNRGKRLLNPKKIYYLTKIQLGLIKGIEWVPRSTGEQQQIQKKAWKVLDFCSVCTEDNFAKQSLFHVPMLTMINTKLQINQLK